MGVCVHVTAHQHSSCRALFVNVPIKLQFLPQVQKLFLQLTVALRLPVASVPCQCNRQVHHSLLLPVSPILVHICLTVHRFTDMSADHGAVAKELERANEEFKEFERKDIKYREDLKHLKAKLKKLQEKLTKDTAKMQVRRCCVATGCMHLASALISQQVLCIRAYLQWLTLVTPACSGCCA